MTPKEKAQELIKKYEPYVYPYVGSSYMTGDEYPEQILKYAKICALIAVDEIKEQLLINLDNEISGIHGIYWEMVKQEIEKL